MPSTRTPFSQEEFSRPLSGHYDNLSDPNLSRPKSAFDIKFRFDEQPARMHNTQSNTNAEHHQGCNEQQPAQPALPHQYENVFEAVHMRNLLRDHKSTINDARSEFFGLNTSKTQKTVNNNYSPRKDDICLIHESEKPAKIMSKNNYDNFESEFNDLNLSEKKISPTSSSSNSSSTTITPSSSPVRGSRGSSNGNKSPKFKLPESPVNSPSQAVYLQTTVPQNIKGSNIMGRHKPTRNSLRHSRMITVNNKHFQDSISSSNSLNIRYLLLAKIVLVWKMIIGVCLTTLGVWLLLWAPSTRTRDNPYWSGAILIASGFLGLFLLSFKRKRSTKLKGSFFMFVKINESVIIILSVFLTTLAFIYATIHYFNLSSDNKQCLPENVFVASSSCICRFNVNGLTNKNLSIGQINENGSLTTPHSDSIGMTEIPKNLGLEFHYRDLSCTEVVGAWVYILLGSLVLNLIGLVLSVIFLTQFVFGCKKKEKYLSVRQSA